MGVVDVRSRLRGEGHRWTEQRRAVWEALHDAPGHLTVDELHAAVTATSPDVNVASVYRTLTLLAELDLAREVHLGDGRGRWELAHPDDEFHLLCRECGRVTHHTGGALVAQVREHLGDGHGFQAEDVELIVKGRCAECVAA